MTGFHNTMTTASRTKGTFLHNLFHRQRDHPNLYGIDRYPVTPSIQDRPIVAALAPCPVIDPEHARRERRLRSDLAEAAQQGRRADRHADPGCQVSSRVAALRQGDGVVNGSEAVGMAGAGTGNLRQALAERAPRAGIIATSKAPDMHEEDDRASEAGQITETAPVMAMHSSRF